MNRPLLQRFSLYFAWLISLIAFILSLYYSEVVKMHPCVLCWYQRIFMFPLVIILAIAAYKRDYGIYPYVLSLVILGSLFALLHFLMQTYPALATPKLCGWEGSCEHEKYFLWGLSFPLLSLLSFILIGISMIFARKKSR